MGVQWDDHLLVVYLLMSRQHDLICYKPNYTFLSSLHLCLSLQHRRHLSNLRFHDPPSTSRNPSSSCYLL